MLSTAGVFLESCLLQLLHGAWQAALLASIVGCLTWALKSQLSPRWRFVLWLVVLIRLAMPVLPAARWSVFGLVESRTVSPPAAHTHAVLRLYKGEESAPSSIVTPNQDVAKTIGGADVPPTPTESAKIAAPTAPRPQKVASVALLAALAWLMGVFLFGARFVASTFQLNSRRRSWREITEPEICRLFERCREELPIARHVLLCVSPDSLGPATCGVVRPVIVVPQSVLSQFTIAELRLVLLHELIHVRRFDILVAHISTLIAVFHWFNPVAWITRHVLRREAELACDAGVLDRISKEHATAYGHVVLKAANMLSIRRPLPGLVGMFSRGSFPFLERRVRMIASYRRPTLAGFLVGLMTLLTLMLTGLTDAQTESKNAAVQTTKDVPPAAEVQTEASTQGTIIISGNCHDENQRPFAAAAISLYRLPPLGSDRAERLQSIKPNGPGRFSFQPVPAPKDHDRYVVVATAPGRSSQFHYISAETQTEAQFSLVPAATIEGQVTDQAGHPVAGAAVFVFGLPNEPIEGVMSTTTDAQGRYAIKDLAPCDFSKAEPVKEGDNTFLSVTECYFTVRHPDFAQERPGYKRIPATIDVKLTPAATLEGRVLDDVSGAPAPGVTVSLQGLHNGGADRNWHSTTTNVEGRYRLGSLRAGVYNVLVDATDRTCPALDSFRITEAVTNTAPDLRLVEGGWIEGRLLDADNSSPVVRDPATGQRLRVAAYGPSRPKSGPACQSAEVDDQGRFSMRVAPGRNFPYIMYPHIKERVLGPDLFAQGIDVGPNELVTVLYRILPKKPTKYPELAPVRQTVPVATERRAAARMRQLGGWYTVDDERHVIEVNMVYHETAEKSRYDNAQVDTDDALRSVVDFPKLQRLFLKNGQASDEALVSVEKLPELRVLMVWDATGVTDSGIGHLAELKELQNIHCNNGQIGDASLAVFGKLPKLESLSMQQNRFTDIGLKYLMELKNLKSLWIGMNATSFTDEAAESLSALSSLEELDLQGSHLSDVATSKLSALTSLRRLYVGGDEADSRITDASVDSLVKLTKVEYLGVENTNITAEGVRRLCKLPHLKQLQLSSGRFGPSVAEQLQKECPAIQLFVIGHLSAE